MSTSSNAAVDAAVAHSQPRFGPNHRWTILGIGVAAQASFSASFAGIPVTGITMRAAYHLSNYTLGLALGAIYLGIALSEIFWGLWTDRLGERRVLLAGLLSTGAMLALMALAVVPSAGWTPSAALLAGCLLVVGALGGSVNGSSGRAVMAWFREGQRGFAMSVRQTAIPVGGAIGTALLPWLAVAYGFRAVFGVLALFCFATAAATWRWLHEPPLAAPAAGAAASATTEDRSPLRRWDVWRLALASGLLTVPQIGVLTFTAVFLHDAKHAGTLAVVLTLLVVQFGGAAARIWTGRYTDVHGNRRAVVAWIGALAGIAMAGAALLTHAPTVLAAAAIAVGGLLASTWHGVAYTEIAAMAGARRAGTALGLENTTAFTAAFITPLMIPVVLAWSSWPVVWAFAAAASLLAVPLVPRQARAGRPAR